MDQVDIPLEGIRRADREADGRDLVAEGRSQRSSAADGSAFSRSLLLIKKHAAVPVDRPSATACSRPASTPVEASITKSTPSVAANPSITSAMKSG
jgi:hypothetical protein